MIRLLFAVVAMVVVVISGGAVDAEEWITRFRFEAPLVGSDGIGAGTIGALPSFRVRAPEVGMHLVRVALPFAPGALPEGLGVEATLGGSTVPVDLRALTFHPGAPRSVRRGMVTFPYAFETGDAQTVTLALVPGRPPVEEEVSSPGDAWQGGLNGVNVRVERDLVQIDGGDGSAWTATLIAPPATGGEAVAFEVVESGEHYLWVRALVPDPAWPRVIEVQLDSLGTAVVQGHVQRLVRGDGTAPDLGWTVEGPPVEEEVSAGFAEGDGDLAVVGVARSGDRLQHTGNVPGVGYGNGWTMAFPVAGLDRRGGVEAGNEVAAADGPRGDLRSEAWRGQETMPQQRGQETMPQQRGQETMPQQRGQETTPQQRVSEVAAAAEPPRNDALGGSEGVRGLVRFLRCRAEEEVPMQETAWRRACFVIGKEGFTPRSPLLLPEVEMEIAAAAHEPLQPVSDLSMSETSSEMEVRAGAFDALYPVPDLPSLALWPELEEMHQYHHDAIVQSVAIGDDAGNVTGFNHGSAHGGYYGMNRLNHNPAIFREAWRSGDARLREVAALWCSNMYDLSVWWGAEAFGGTRYNAAVAAGETEHEGDTNFMWRTNWASHFCTKGYDSFFYAYEETGDPRMLAALRAQVAYANATIHTNTGEARNIGDVTDYMNLYRCTGATSYRDEALRLFRELREKLSPADLFSQSGALIVEDGPFIDDDQHGYEAPFAKPYIIGYALAGLPDLLREFPDEPKLRDVVRAVADFMAESQDPVGGWRYPHPRSSRTIISQGLEHAAQIARAAAVLEERGEDISNLIDAIERVLQARVNGFARTGMVLAGLTGWEQTTGAVNETTSIYDLYEKPDDRDPSRDYTEGGVGLGSAPPEGLVYLPEVLAFYLQHRPAERLFHTTEELAAVLARTEDTRAESQSMAIDGPLGYGMRAHLPHFSEARVARMEFPLAWRNAADDMDFATWRGMAREVYLASLLERPPLARFEVETIATEAREGYIARKIALNLSEDTRVEAYLLVPEGEGPFPAVVALHDHGAHFSIGKEKVIRPFGVSDERMVDAQAWVNECYGGRWFGDELAKRGYVVFATDALFWGDRGRAEGVAYEEQQALAANMFQLGLSWAGTIVWDDIRSAEFVQGLAEVDPDRIACMGLSMGSNRAWHLTAATDIVKAGAAICWMGDTPTLMAEGNNQTKGQSAFSMLHPGLRNALDYADVASIACPKPMLFYNGEQDGLFPVDGVEACYGTMHRVWASQGAEERLETRLWAVPHVFDVAMQEAAFAWLDGWLTAAR